jgi:hypothetical protein
VFVYLQIVEGYGAAISYMVQVSLNRCHVPYLLNGGSVSSQLGLLTNITSTKVMIFRYIVDGQDMSCVIGPFKTLLRNHACACRPNS